MPNPWAILSAVVLIALAYFGGRFDGQLLAEAATVREERIATLAYEKSQEAAAKAIAGLEIKNVTYNNRIERETREVPVYRSAGCLNTPAGMRIINEALTNGSWTSGDSELPRESGATAGQ